MADMTQGEEAGKPGERGEGGRRASVALESGLFPMGWEFCASDGEPSANDGGVRREEEEEASEEEWTHG